MLYRLRTRKFLTVLAIGVTLVADARAQFFSSDNEITAARVGSTPKNAATKTITSFSPALRCMDELFLAFGKRGIVITSAGIPDETGKVKTGTKEMLITAVSNMTRHSNAFEFIDLHAGGDDLGKLFELKGGISKIPDYYIRGSITQMDDNAIRKTKGAGISLPFFDFGGSKDDSFDLVSMDISIGEAATRRILPDTSTSNTMLVQRSGKSLEGGGSGSAAKIGKIGLSFNMDFSQSEGLGATTRSLLELGLIETLGKFTKVPYWRCLDVDATNPVVINTARDWYDSAGEVEKVTFYQQKLAALNRYNGPIDGKPNQLLKNAVAEYQSAANLIADGRMNFDLYYSLLDDIQNKLYAAPGSASAAPVAPPPPETLSPPPPRPIPDGNEVVSQTNKPTQGQVSTQSPVSQEQKKNVFSLRLDSERGTKPTYKVGEFLNLTLNSNGNGIAWCFYEDVGKKVARIFPNQFNYSPNLNGSTLRLPAGGFKIRFDRPGRERVVCIASDRDMVQPSRYSGVPDLRPIAVSSMEELVGEFKKANPLAVASSVEITVE